MLTNFGHSRNRVISVLGLFVTKIFIHYEVTERLVKKRQIDDRQFIRS